MNCPKCNVTMEKITYEGVEVDRCTACKGLWFDFREQQQLKNVKGAAAELDSGDPEDGQRLNEVGKINCPRDGVVLTHMVDLKQPHIWYEACPHCYGVFFDAGEFKDYSRKTLLDSVRDLFSEGR